MFYRQQKLRPISKEKYFHLWNKAVKKAGSEMFADLIFECRRKLKIGIIPQGLGIMQHIKEYERITKEASDDDYNYFIQDGHEDVIMGGEKLIEEYKKALNDLNK